MQVLKCTRVALEPSWVASQVDRIVEGLSGLDSVEEIYLFGSAAEGKMTDQSDFDFLLVVSDETHIRRAQKELRSQYPISEYPVDLVWVSRQRFDEMKNIGGVCFVAHTEGKQMFLRKPTP